MTTLSAEQFQALLATITKTGAAASSARNAAATLGPIRQCSLGSDKMRKLTLFNEWLKEAENCMECIVVLVSPTIKKRSYCSRRGSGGASDITKLIKLEKTPFNIKTESTEPWSNFGRKTNF